MKYLELSEFSSTPYRSHAPQMRKSARSGVLLMGCVGLLTMAPVAAAQQGAHQAQIAIRVVACPSDAAVGATGYYAANCIINGKNKTSVRFSGVTSGIGKGRKVMLSVTDKAGTRVVGEGVVTDGGAWAVEGLDLSRLVDGKLAIQANVAGEQGDMSGASASGELAGESKVQDVRLMVGTNRYALPASTSDRRIDIYRRDAHEIGIGGATEDIKDGSVVAIDVSDVKGGKLSYSAGVHLNRWVAPGLNLSRLASGPLTISAKVADAHGALSSVTEGGLAAIVDDPDYSIDLAKRSAAQAALAQQRAGLALSASTAPAGKGIGLHAAVQSALDYDARLYGAHWGAEAARVNVALSKRVYLPQVTLSTGVDVEKYDYTKGGTNSERSDSGQYGLNVSWRLYDFGASQRRVGAALARQESEALREERMRDVVTFDLVAAYMDVYRLRKLLDINQRNRIAHRELTEVVQARVKQGLGSDVRLKEAVLRLQDIEYEREDLIQQSKDAAESYRLLTGNVPDDLFPEIEHARKLPLFTAENIETLIALAAERHPELASARNEIDAEAHDIEALHREHLPKIDLNLGYNRVFNPAPKGASYERPRIGVSMTWQIFGNLVNQQVSQAVAKREQQIANYNRILHETERNVRTGADSILSTRARLDQIAASTRSAAEIAKLRLQQFKTQNMSDDSVLAMSNAFNQRFRAEASELNVRLKGILAEYGLESNLGLLRLEFAEPVTPYGDRRALSDLPMTVPEYASRSKFRFNQDVPRRYERLPQATPVNGLGRDHRDSDCLLCSPPDERH
jgi:outer membrane protein